MSDRPEFRQPEGINAHNFSCCDTHGGSAFRNWYMLLKHNGVFIGFHNHDWCVLFSSDPMAEWGRGCRESCAYGDPRPQSGKARLVGFDQLPPEARPLALRWIREAVEIARDRITRAALADAARQARAAQLAAETHGREVAAPWLAAAKNGA